MEARWSSGQVSTRKARLVSRSVRPASRSRTYSSTTFSMEPRYFFVTGSLPSTTSRQGWSFSRLAPSAVAVEQRPPFFI